MPYNPTCRKCGKEHYNFDPCPTPARPDLIQAGDGYAPEGWRVETRFGQPWGNAPRGVPIIYQHPPVVRTSTLTFPAEKETP